METIRKIFPDIKAIGNAGFFGYIVFFNPKKNVYAVESVLENNATYILGEDWERITQMTKSEILNGGLAIKRVIHSENWEFEISRFR